MGKKARIEVRGPMGTNAASKFIKKKTSKVQKRAV